MNKDIQEFTNAYLSIINEDADKKYHNIREIATAVKTTTNNCQDMWVKGQSGQDVLKCMFSWPDDRLFVSDFELKYIANYWKGKANSGNKFDTDMAAEIGKAVEELLNGTRFPHAFLRFKVGIIAYGVWKALNVKQQREASNRSKIENSNVDQEYANVSDKKLKLVDWRVDFERTSFTSIPSNWAFICKDENDFKVVVKVRESDKVGCKIIEALHISQNLELSREQLLSKYGLTEITIKKATLGRINKDYKTIYLNRAIIEYPTNFSLEDGVEAFRKQIEDDINAHRDAKYLDRANAESPFRIVDIITEWIKERDFKQKTKEEQIKLLNHIINEILADKIKDKSQNIKDAIKEDLEDALKEAFPNNYQEYIDIISF